MSVEEARGEIHRLSWHPEKANSLREGEHITELGYAINNFQLEVQAAIVCVQCLNNPCCCDRTFEEVGRCHGECVPCKARAELKVPA